MRGAWCVVFATATAPGGDARLTTLSRTFCALHGVFATALWWYALCGAQLCSGLPYHDPPPYASLATTMVEPLCELRSAHPATLNHNPGP